MRQPRRTARVLSFACCAAGLAIVSCATPPARHEPVAEQEKPTVEGAQQFARRLDADLRRLSLRSNTAEWIKATYITDDTERNAASANEELIAYVTSAIGQAARFDGLPVDPQTARMLHLVKISATLPAPNDAKKRNELTTIAARLDGMYGKGKYCGPDGKGECRDLQQLEEVLRKSRDAAALQDAWEGWHKVSVPMRPLYERLVTLSNEGARELGFADTSEIWRSGYDMTPQEIEAETGRLWQQVKPLYDALHCHVRAKLAERYGSKVVPEGQPLPAHLLGNMWAQDWSNIYPLVEPYPGATNLDVGKKLAEGNYDARKMTKLAERFFTSLGLDPLPQTFWERSMLTKPRDRDVVCHASAWDLTSEGDVRIKMCIEVNEENLETLHHELGHDYYSWYRRKLPILFNTAANDGFDEAIGDAIQHSVTPGYLKSVGLLDELPKDEHGLVNVQMKEALQRVAFLPFGKMIDQWRWDVFSGRTAPADYNAAWWKLRREYQGLMPPVARTEAQFDPGAKYHIPANVPYLRYFIAAILQYQFHRALCAAAGQTGPLHQCSIYGNKAAGDRLRAMLELGASKPWQDALQAISGERAMDATALLDYFAPLKRYLDEENKGRRCGW